LSKIVILGPAHPLRGGLATYNERLAREFIKQGDEVIIFTFSLQYPSILFPGKTQLTESPKPEGLDIRVNVNSINPFNWIKIGRQLKKIKPDMLMMRFWIPFMAPCLGTIAKIARRYKHTKAIALIDNIIPHEKRPGDRILSNYFVKSMDGFVAQSRTVLEEMKSFKTDKPVKFNPHPLFDNFGSIIPKNKAKEMLGLDMDTNYILFFGFIRNYKGLDLLLKAMANAKLSDMPVKLIIAGEYYGDPKPYQEIIRELQLQDKVIEHNHFIANEEVYKYFNACDVVVQPYKSATQSGVTQIGYHFHKPMIVTNVGGLPEIIPDGKVGFVTDTNANAIAEAIFRFYSENREAEFTANAASECKKYAWDKMVATMKELAGIIPSSVQA
jgi:D-inositol-3-phosphate glycosyltransferase